MANLLLATKPPPIPSYFTSLQSSSSPSIQLPNTTHLSASFSLSSSPKFHHQTYITQESSSQNGLQNLLHEPRNSSDFASLMDSCSCLSVSTQIHAQVVKSGFRGHEFLETKLLQMYGRCESVESAALVFEKMPLRNIYSWAGILAVYTNHGYFEEAFQLFQQMQFEGIELEFFIFPILLKACSGLSALEVGSLLHTLLIKGQFITNIYVGNALIDMYGKCGSLDGARKVLETMPERDIVSWNSIVTGFATNGMVYEALECLEKMHVLDNVTPNLVTWSAAIGGSAQNGYDEEALRLIYRMQEARVKPNARTLASVLPACARLQILRSGKEIHGYIMRHGYVSNSFVVNGLVDVYRRCGDMGTALKLFLKFSTRNLVSFNTMIVGYCENGEVYKARELFDQMELSGIKKDTISWNSMISGYVDNGQFEEALMMFRDMQMEDKIETDSFTLGSVLTACANMNTLGQGKLIHSSAIIRGLHSNAFVGGALVELYCRFGDLEAAQVVFNNVTERDTTTWNVLISGYSRLNQMGLVDNLLDQMKDEGLDPNTYTWNGIITGYVENGYNELALQLFCKMQTEYLKPDIYTIGMALHACSKLATIERGRQIHAHSIRRGYATDIHIGATLVDMYAKCGTVKHAQKAFNLIPKHNLVSQNTMLAGYAMHGHWKEGISLFHQMLTDRIRPDEVTFLSVLLLCVHAGSVDEGQKCFSLMENYDIKPQLKHYTCMVDLYSRAGHLYEAYELIKKMPVEPDTVAWGSLLSGCVTYQNAEMGEIAANRLIGLDTNNAGNYVILANLYGSVGRWDDFARTRQMIKDRGMQKSPGCSWIEDRDGVHVFLANERSHEQTHEIHATLKRLALHIRQED